LPLKSRAILKNGFTNLIVRYHRTDSVTFKHLLPHSNHGFEICHWVACDQNVTRLGQQFTKRRNSGAVRRRFQNHGPSHSARRDSSDKIHKDLAPALFVFRGQVTWASEL